MTILQYSCRQRIFRILNDVGTGRFTPGQLAQMVGCQRDTAANYCREWNKKDDASPPETEQCVCCSFHGWDHNPIYNGICLWCWADLAGLDLRGLVSEIGWKGVISMLETTDKQCTYCSEPVFTPNFINPPMCRRHYEITLLISRLERRDRPVTVDNLRALLARQCTRFAITAADIPVLLQDVQDRQEPLSALEGESHAR